MLSVIIATHRARQLRAMSCEPKRQRQDYCSALVACSLELLATRR